MARIATTCLVLMTASAASAGIQVRMEVTDRGEPNRDRTLVYSPGQYTPRMGVPTDPGEELLVHIFMKSDTSVDIRSVQVQWTTSTYPVDLMGVDVNTRNQQRDGIGNFWFDYTGLGEIEGIIRWGSFPGECSLTLCHNIPTGEYIDFSNVLGGSPLAPIPASTVFLADPAFPQLDLPADEWVHLGAMPIVTPGTSAGEQYKLDFVTPTRDEINSATFIQHGFDSPQLIASAGGDDILAYADGSSGLPGGPIVYDGTTGIFSIVPEPATLALLGCGGIAALPRRRQAA